MMVERNGNPFQYVPSHKARYCTNLIFMVQIITIMKMLLPEQPLHPIHSSAHQRHISHLSHSSSHNSRRQRQRSTPLPTSIKTRQRRCPWLLSTGRNCIFDVRITKTSCRSNRNKNPDDVLKRHEKEKKKKDKYRDICLERRMDFCPLVYSVDGIPGRGTRAAEKYLAKMLAYKWNRPYMEMVHYVQVRMSVAVVCSNSLL